jgi:uncharacterized protein DUF6925
MSAACFPHPRAEQGRALVDMKCLPLSEDPSRIARRHLAEPANGWSVGTWGAIGEFQYDAGEAGLAVDLERLAVESRRGALQIESLHEARCLAIVEESGDVREIAFCSTRRGSSRTAIRQLDEFTFDLGIGAPHIDVLVRLSPDDRATHKALSEAEGRHLLDSGHSAAAAVARASPTRVFVSALARLEVHQPIPPPGGRSPEGPHSHLLPRLLQAGLTRPPGSPLPAGLYCGLSLYPRQRL